MARLFSWRASIGFFVSLAWISKSFVQYVAMVSSTSIDRDLDATSFAIISKNTTTKEMLLPTNNSNRAAFVSSVSSKSKHLMYSDDVTTPLMKKSTTALHTPGISSLLSWELESIQPSRTCLPANPNIPRYCCLGSISEGGRMTFQPHQCNRSIIYKQVQDYAMDFLRHQPQPYYHEHRSTHRNISTSLIHDKHHGDHHHDDNHDFDCDECQIVRHLMTHNLTLAFVGDSLTRQTGQGFQCALLRRGDYTVITTKVRAWTKRQGCRWKYCIGEKILFTIQYKDNPHQIAHVYHYGVYRPANHDDNSETKEEIVAKSDIVVFDHGLHWKPSEAHDFQTAMTAYLKSYYHNKSNDNSTNTTNKKLTLVAWRETTAQHFNATGGHYGTGREADGCVPIISTTNDQPVLSAIAGFRLPLMQKAAHDAGFIWRNAMGATFTEEAVMDNELVVLPYRNFTVPLHYLHPDECTHYCHTPHVWLPIWRSLRIAMDRAIFAKF